MLHFGRVRVSKRESRALSLGMWLICAIRHDSFRLLPLTVEPCFCISQGELPGSGLYPSGIDILKIIDLNTTITLRGRQLEEGKRRQLAPLDIIDLKADSFESLLPGLFETGLTASTLWAELITNGDIAQITEALSTMMGTTDEGRRHLQDCLDDNGLIDCLVDFFITPEVTQGSFVLRFGLCPYSYSTIVCLTPQFIQSHYHRP